MRRRWRLADFAFPAPPVPTHRWTDADFLRYARRAGFVRRQGPAPTVVLAGLAWRYVDGHYTSEGARAPLFGR